MNDIVFGPTLAREVRLTKREKTLVLAVAAFLSLSLQPRHAAADIFQYTDENGVVHFSNVGVGSSKKYRVKPEPGKNQSTGPSSQTPRGAAQTASPNMPSAYLDSISAACDRHGVDPALVRAIIKVESDFNPYALSRKGAMGLMQLMPQTAVEMNVKNSFNPHENIAGGVKYLRYLMDRYEGNLSLALAAYNCGETTVKRWGTVPPIRETQQYVKRILSIYNGKGTTFTPRYTIYIGHGEDGVLTLTDNPSNHQNKKLTRKTAKDL